MDDLRRPRRSQSVRWRILNEEGVLVNLDTQTYFTLNPVGLFIWDRCTGSFSPDQIVDDLANEFEVDAQRARADLEAFLRDLSAEGLIELHQAPATA